MEAQVKERLTGAVILVALIVLLVPELLTGPGKKAEPVAIPPGGSPMRSITIDLVEGGVRPAAVPAAQPAEASLTARVASPTAAAAKPDKAPPVVAAQPPVRVAPEEIPAAESIPRKGWSVQLGSFASRDNAQRLVRELTGKGFAAYMLEGGGTSGKLYRVRVGPERDRDSATTLEARLRSAGQPGSVIAPD